MKIRRILQITVQTFFFVFFLFSCGTRNAQLISEVEKLEEQLKKAQQSIASIDTSKIGNYLQISTENLKYIQENYKDTLNKENAFLLSDYSSARKSLKRFSEQYSDVIRELSYTQAQLSALKADVENNIVDEQKFSDYFNAESKSVEKLAELTNNLNNWYASALRVYEEKNPSIEKFISQLKEKQN